MILTWKLLCLAKLAYQILPRKVEDDEIQDDAWPYLEAILRRCERPE